jgi:hypothetical protein
MSQAYHVRPSAILGITEGLPAYAVDRAVWTFARAIEAAQEEAVKRLPKKATEALQTSTRTRVLDVFLGVDRATAGRYADPAIR